MNNQMNPVVHFEMPATDRNRMAAFYTHAFGWKFEMLGPDMGDYTVAMTTETDEEGRPTKPGAINGGFFPKSDDTPAQPSLVIAVENLQDAIKKVRDSGGEILGEPTEIPEVGQFVSFLDTEGNRVSMLQPLVH